MTSTALKEAATGKAQAQSTAIATVKMYFDKHRDQIQNALPRHIKPDRMVRLALTALSQSQALQKCDPRSIFGSVITASQLGLEIGVLGQGFLVPYKGRATFIPGWQGLADLVSRAGRATVWTGAVFDGDDFDYALGDAPFIKHKPLGDEDPKRLTHVYAVGRVNGSQWPVIEVWPIAKIWKHRDRFNKVGGDHYSYQNPEMYARKVVLLQVLKYIPKSIELQNALVVNDAGEAGARAVIDGDFVQVQDDDDSPTPVQQNADAQETQPQGQAKGQEAGETSTSSSDAPAAPVASARAATRSKPVQAKEPEKPAAKPAAAPPAGETPKGNAKLRDELVAKMQQAKDTDELLAIATEANNYEWADALFTTLNTAFHERNKKLLANESAQDGNDDDDD